MGGYESSLDGLRGEKCAVEDALASERKAFETRLEEVRAEREAARVAAEELAVQRGRWESEMDALRREHSAAINELRRDHEAVVSRMATTHSLSLATMTKGLEETLENERAQLQWEGRCFYEKGFINGVRQVVHFNPEAT